MCVTIHLCLCVGGCIGVAAAVGIYEWVVGMAWSYYAVGVAVAVDERTSVCYCARRSGYKCHCMCRGVLQCPEHCI